MNGQQGFGFGLLPAVRNFVVARANMVGQNVQNTTQNLQNQGAVATAVDQSPFGPGGAARQANRQQLRPMNWM